MSHTGGSEDRLDNDTAAARDYRARGMAAEAQQAIRSHETLNNLQFQQVEQKLKDLKDIVEDTCGKVEALSKKIDDGFASYNNKIIGLLATIVLLLLGGLTTAIWFILTESHKYGH